MDTQAENHQSALDELIAYLFNRRETLLNNWRTVCESDPALKKIAVLSREEFNNLMPIIFESLEQLLQGNQPETSPIVAAQSHGLQRWQKSLELPSLIKELSHLSVILIDELKLFRQLFPQANPDFVLQAQRQIMVLMNEIIGGSVAKHDELQRLEAANRATSLQQALEQMEELSRQRGDLLRTTSHDLRSGLGISLGAAYLLQTDELSQEERHQYVDMLNRNLVNLQSLLTELMDLARLEAGHEPLQLEEFDAAQLLMDLVDSVKPTAMERNLIIRADGPAPLVVRTDRLKLYRVAQNLILNAVNYTPSNVNYPGLVSVSWSTENDWRWGFSVQNSGPGLPAGLLELFHKQLKPIVEGTSVMSPDESQPVSPRPNMQHQLPADVLADQPATPRRQKGEGIGLQIVKRLCELLGASMEIESIAGRGTLFRIRMPIHASS
jgi:signal transduction histidine kinase